MASSVSSLHPMPDVSAHARPEAVRPLDWVGMSRIEMPVRFDAGDGLLQQVPARVDAFVNLIRPGQRGIHMSRLYLLAERALSEDAMDAPRLKALLEAFLASHEGISDQARIALDFELMTRRPALRSANRGWRIYPLRLEAQLAGTRFDYQWHTEVVYSSTCPQSAALSRQLIQQRFAQDFAAERPLSHERVLAWLGSEQGLHATPHAQRSVARLKLRPAAESAPSLLNLLDRVERALATPVQTVVKREDEQAFAAANGANLMFCEDAARRIMQALDEAPGVTDFALRVEHQESLHPHDAVAYASKGMVGGFAAGDERLAT